MRVVCSALLLSCAAAKNPPDLNPGYIEALGAADHFLQAWQNGDVENGIALLSSHAKAKLGHDALETYFSVHGPLGYEIERGKMLRAGRYSFPVVLVSMGPGRHVRRRFSSIVVLSSGHNDWAVDNLP